jgi:hypothetical protein
MFKSKTVIKKLPKNMPPPPKPGMVLVKKKRAAPTSSKNEEADAKKKRIEDLKALESKMKSKEFAFETTSLIWRIFFAIKDEYENLI